MVQKTASDVSNRQLQAKFGYSGWVQPAAQVAEHVYSISLQAPAVNPAGLRRHTLKSTKSLRTLRQKASPRTLRKRAF